MDPVHAVELLRQPPHDAVGAALGATEDNRLLGLLSLHELNQQVELPFIRDGEIKLFDCLDGDFGRRAVHGFMVNHVATGQALDRRRNRRAEQQRLSILGTALENLLDVRSEADIQHAIGFVEHHAP